MEPTRGWFVSQMLLSDTVASSTSLVQMLSVFRRSRLEKDTVSPPVAKRLRALGEAAGGELLLNESRLLLRMNEPDVQIFAVPARDGTILCISNLEEVSAPFVVGLINHVFWTAEFNQGAAQGGTFVLHGLVSDEVEGVTLITADFEESASLGENAFVLVKSVKRVEQSDLRALRLRLRGGRSVLVDLAS
jgi:hypothetical protein